MARPSRNIRTMTQAECLDYVVRVTALRLLHPSFCGVRRCRRDVFCTGAPVHGAKPTATSAMFGAPTDIHAPVCFAHDTGPTGAAFCALLEETIRIFQDPPANEPS